MAQINWEQYGLRKNPYDTLPLIEGGELPLEKAFVGRTKEREYLNDLFASDTRLNVVICGEVGAGKTSLASFHKFWWKYQERSKPLFSFRREIEANINILDKKNFILEIIGSVLAELKLLAPGRIEKDDFLSKLDQLLNVTQTISMNFGASIAGWGGEMGESKSTSQPFHLTTVMAEQYLMLLLQWIKNNKIQSIQYQGLIVHVNNFDIVLEDNPNKVKDFFNEIRDLLQHQDLYVMFLGPQALFHQIIQKHPRLLSVFHRDPIILRPLSKQEINSALQERYEILKSDGVRQAIKPVADEFVSKLYDIFQGDIRSIFSALKDLLSSTTNLLPRTLTPDEGMLLLGKERWRRIENKKFSEEQLKVLKHIALSSTPLSQKEIAISLRKAQANISGYYFKPLYQHQIIELVDQKGKEKYWHLTKEYAPIKFMLQAQSNLKSTLKTKYEQLNYQQLALIS